jgi:hypothetical protein
MNRTCREESPRPDFKRTRVAALARDLRSAVVSQRDLRAGYYERHAQEIFP